MPEIPENNTGAPKKVSFIRPLIFILALAGLFIAARAFNLQEYIEEDRLRRFIAAGGMWGPVIYLLVWAIVPTLFLPCLPLTLAGGVLFGRLRQEVLPRPFSRHNDGVSFMRQPFLQGLKKSF